MKDIIGNLFEQDCDAIAITTNGFVKRDGTCVMGMGCAKQAKSMFVGIDKYLGTVLKLYGNCVHLLHQPQTGYNIVSFPVKPIAKHIDQTTVVKHMQSKFAYGMVPGWACVAELEIIETSARQLVLMADSYGWQNVVIPRPGCGAGELSYSDVRPILESILDDRFSVITFS